jgi:hypothetical protein
MWEHNRKEMVAEHNPAVELAARFVSEVAVFLPNNVFDYY